MMQDTTPATKAPLATVMISRNEHSGEEGNQWLMQLHPLDLEQGRIELDREPVVIGRSEECRIRLVDDSVSREHARIVWSEAGHEITDLGSTNGVFVNDVQIDHAVLTSGDRIQLGQRIFRFLEDNDKESKYYETVYTMMTRDGLTGAFNKRYLTECLDREVVRSRKYDRPLSMIMIDIDHFKSVNDTHGHLAGDEVLRELALRIQGQNIDGAVFARFGGEEFAIVAVETDLKAAEHYAESCRRIVEARPFDTSSGMLDITISMGVASLDANVNEDPESLLAAADLRLYEAKRGGRNRVVAR